MLHCVAYTHKQTLIRMKYTQINASMIDFIGYDEDSETLEVRFLANKNTYECLNIPKSIYKELMSSASKANYMREIIKRYGGTEIQEKKPTQRPKKSIFDKYIGDYLITSVFEFSLNANDWLSIEENGIGKFYFSGIEGVFSGIIEEDEEDEMLVISWFASNSINKEVKGTGFFILDDHRANIEGRITFEGGKDHYFCATREEVKEL